MPSIQAACKLHLTWACARPKSGFRPTECVPRLYLSRLVLCAGQLLEAKPPACSPCAGRTWYCEAASCSRKPLLSCCRRHSCHAKSVRSRTWGGGRGQRGGVCGGGSIV